MTDIERKDSEYLFLDKAELAQHFYKRLSPAERERLRQLVEWASKLIPSVK